MKYIALFILILSGSIIYAQQIEECTDIQAENFIEAAQVNDGSCLYQDTLVELNFIFNLSDTLIETSGLTFFNNQLWTHNDSGNNNELYLVNTETGNVLKTVKVSNAVNIDWESMAQSETHLFVGDFGNNSGARQDLNILKLKKEDFNRQRFCFGRIYTFQLSRSN